MESGSILHSGLLAELEHKLELLYLRASLYLAKTSRRGNSVNNKAFPNCGRGVGYRSSGVREEEEEEGWVCTIVENECRATRNFQLGLKGLVRDSLASAFTATPLNSLVTVH